MVSCQTLWRDMPRLDRLGMIVLFPKLRLTKSHY